MNNGSYSSFQETQVNRFFLGTGNGWLMTSGFVAVKWFAGFANDERITEDTWHVVAVAQCEDTSGVDTHGP